MSKITPMEMLKFSLTLIVLICCRPIDCLNQSHFTSTRISSQISTVEQPVTSSSYPPSTVLLFSVKSSVSTYVDDVTTSTTSSLGLTSNISIYEGYTVAMLASFSSNYSSDRTNEMLSTSVTMSLLPNNPAPTTVAVMTSSEHLNSPSSNTKIYTTVGINYANSMTSAVVTPETSISSSLDNPLYVTTSSRTSSISSYGSYSTSVVTESISDSSSEITNEVSSRDSMSTIPTAAASSLTLMIKASAMSTSVKYSPATPTIPQNGSLISQTNSISLAISLISSQLTQSSAANNLTGRTATTVALSSYLSVGSPLSSIWTTRFSTVVLSFSSATANTVNGLSEAKGGATPSSYDFSSIRSSVSSSQSSTSATTFQENSTTPASSLENTSNSISTSFFTTVKISPQSQTSPIITYSSKYAESISSSVITSPVSGNSSGSLLPTSSVSSVPVSNFTINKNGSESSTLAQNYSVLSIVNTPSDGLTTVTSDIDRTRVSTTVSMTSSIPSETSIRSSSIPIPSTVPTVPGTKGEKQGQILVIALGCGGGGLFLFILIGCIIVIRKRKRNNGGGPTALKDFKEKGDATTLKDHWNTLQRGGSSKSPLKSPGGMYGGDDDFELQNANINGSAVVDLSSNELLENDVNENESDELRDSCATFAGTVKLRKNEGSFIEVINEKRSSQNIELHKDEAPTEAKRKMMTFGRTREPVGSATEKPEQSLFQIGANDDENSVDNESVDNESNDEESLPDPSLIPAPLTDDDQTDAPSSGEADEALTKTGATEIGIENPSLQLEPDDDGAKRLSEYHC